MKKIYFVLAMLILTVSSAWADVQTDFVSVVNPIDGSANLNNTARSTTLANGTVMSFALSGGNLFALDVCNTEWNNTDAVSELNSILDKELSVSAYFPKTTANRNGQTTRTVTCTANLSNTAGYDPSKIVTFYVALYTQATTSTPSLSVSGFSTAEYQYALANGNGFTTVSSVSAIPCATQDYTLVKIKGKLSAGVASVTFSAPNRSGVQWMAIKYNEEIPTVENTYTYYLGEKEIASIKHEDFVGSAPTGALSLPSYVTLVSTDAPETCTETASTFTYNVQYSNLPFELGTPYSLTIRDEATPQYNIYVDPADKTKVKTIRNTNEKWTTPTLGNFNYFNWVMGGDFYNGFTFQNVATGKYLTYGENVSPADNTISTIIDEPNAGAKFILSVKNNRNCFKIKGTTNNTFINKRGDDLSTWASSSADGETGSAITFCEPVVVTLEEMQTRLAALANTTKFELVEGVTVISPSEYAAPSEINAAIDAAKAVDNTDPDAIETFLTGNDAAKIKTFNSASASYGAPLTVIYAAKAGYNTIILPINWSVPSNWTKYSCEAVDGNVLTLTAAAVTGESKNTPYIVLADKDETFQFIGYSNGADTENVKTAGILTGANFATTAPANAYILTNGSDRFEKVYEDTEVTANQCWIVLESNAAALLFEAQPTPAKATANMRITDAGWGTFYATFAVAIPEGVKAYTGTLITESETPWIRMDELTEGVIPANTGVVVAKKVEGEAYSEDLEEIGTTVATASTCYTGNAYNYNVVVEEGAYLLQKNYVAEKQENVVGWYKVQGKGFTLAPNRCYLAKNTVPEAAQTRSFIGFEPVDDATGINSIATEAATKADGKYMVKGQIVVVKAGKAYNMNGTEIK
ncbi:MAG: hypothetical protein K6E45_06935 [Bacteroidaceae bacterium]|nr:hypothetical protein [Bacteroidaceae bacterium]